MKTILNITAIFLMMLFGWWMLFIAIADDANTERVLDYRTWQAQKELQEVNDGK